MKKCISLLLIVSITLSIFQPVTNKHVHAAQIFSDLPETHWAAESVSKLVSLDLINGYPDGTFRPDNPITIEAFVKLTVSALGYTNLPSNGGYWSEPYFLKADELGLFVDEQNYVDVRGEYWSHKSDYIRRKEVAFLLIQAEKIIQNGDIDYEASQEFIKSQIEDLDSINPQYKDAVINAYGLGLINGFPDNTFQPNGNLTRAQAAIVICRLLFEEERVPLMPINKLYSTTSQQWKPSSYGQSADGIIHWKSITYLTKEDANAVYEGTTDSELVADLKAAKKIIETGVDNSAIFLSGAALVTWANKKGLVKLAHFAGGIGGAIVLGYLIPAVTGLIKDADRHLFKNTIDNTNDGCFVQIEKYYTLQITPSGFITVDSMSYNTYNSNTIQGAYNINGSFSSDIDFTTIW